KEPVIIHWLGDMFDPALAGYWGSRDTDRATETLLAIVRDYAPKIDGVKISLLDQAREIAMRRRFPKGVRMYTGDDFDYPTTIRGDGERDSDAPLGISDVIAPVATAAAVGRMRRVVAVAGVESPLRSVEAEGVFRPPGSARLAMPGHSLAPGCREPDHP